MKKIFAMLLAMVMVFTMTGAVAEDNERVLIYGSTTEISGDFAPGAWWTNNATDSMIRELTNDCTTVVMNKEGEYIVNPTVAASVEGKMNEDGSKTYTIQIKDGLKFNNGEDITIKDFVWATAFGCSPVSSEVGAKLSSYESVVGGEAYLEGKAETITGLRILDDKTMSVSIVSKYVPYYYDILYAQFTAQSMKYWLGDAVELKDDGEGVYFEGLTKDAIGETINAARWNADATRVSAGPYNLVEFDKAATQATLTINENYAGNYEGQKPSVPKLVIVKAEEATWFDALKTGAFNLYDTITDGGEVNQAMDLIEDEENKVNLGYGFDYAQFDRPGYGKIQFACDFGPTQFPAVRHAVALCLDRVEFANTFCAGWGGLVNGPYGFAMWMTQESEEWLDENLDNYAYNPEAAIAELEADGWVLDENGNDYVEGIRYKKVTAEEAGDYQHNVKLDNGDILMPLIIEWSSSQGNAVSELLKVMLAESDQTAQVGMKINRNEMTFAELLNFLYRDVASGDKYGVPTYGMFNLASNWPTPAYDRYNDFTTDEKKLADGYNTNFIINEELDQLTYDMVYGVEAGDSEGYLKVWREFIKQWNELLPDIPLYSNIYVTVYPDWLENYEQTSYWSFQNAIVYATVAE